MEREHIEDSARILVSSCLLNRTVSKALNKMLDYHYNTWKHSVNTAFIAAQIGYVMGLGETSLENLVIGSLLHDVGKLQVPLPILNKRGELTEEEYRIMKEHPRLGYNFAFNHGLNDDISDIILHHHERTDGNGYPDNLIKDEIKFLTAIVSTIDMYDAMTSIRGYGSRYSSLKALNILMNSPVVSKSIVDDLSRCEAI